MDKLNEIHGSCYDKENPVVKFSGTLKDENYDMFEVWKEKTDLVLSLGTSMSGMNSDSIGEDCAYRYLKKSKGFGLVIITLQRT